MAVNADLEPMTSSDLDLTSQTETEDTDTGDLEESGTTFSSSDGSDSTLSTMSSSNASKMSKENGLSNMNSVSSTDGSTSTGNDEQVDISNSDFAFKYPSLPKASYDLTEVSELSDVDLSSVCNQKSPTKTQHGEENAGLRDQKTFQFPDFQAMKGAWFTHPCFKRYWDHYSSVMTWCKRHSHAHNSISQKNRSQSTCIPPQDFNQISDMLSWQQYYLNSYYFGTSQFPWNGNFNRRDSTRSTAKASKKKRRKKKNAKSRSGGGQGQSKCSEEDADSAETFEMEITDEMMEFFKQSEEHRRTRDEKRKAEKDAGQAEEEHVNIEDVKVSAQKAPTTEAPKERPGAKRTSEMKLLYGKGAPMIHGMETALQMTFDRNLDVKQPKLWPNMPLKLVFG